MDSLMFLKDFCERYKISKHLQAGFVEFSRFRDDRLTESQWIDEYEKFCGRKIAIRLVADNAKLASYPNPVTETENAEDWLPSADNASKPSEVSGFAPLSFVSHETSEVSRSSQSSSRGKVSEEKTTSTDNTKSRKSAALQSEKFKGSEK